MIFGEENNEQGGSAGQPTQIRLDTNGMETVYANFFAMAGSPEEITIYLGASSPMPGVKEPIVKISSRVILTPQNSKRLMMAMQQAVKAHEDRFGPIEVAPTRKPR